MSLRQKLFLILAALTAVPLLILLFGSVQGFENETRSRVERELHVTLDKMSDELQLIIENQQAIARGLAQDPTLRQFASVATMPIHTKTDKQRYIQHAGQLEQFFLNYQAAVPDIQAIRYLDQEGKTLVKVKEGKPIEPKQLDDEKHRLFVSDQSNKSFFKNILDSSDEVVMSDFELGQLNNEADFCPAMVRYSIKIKDEVDHNEGVLVLNMWGKRLDAAIEASLGGYPGTAYLVEMNPDPLRDGIYLYHRDTRQRFADQLNSEYRFTKQINQLQWQQIKSGGEQGSFSLADGRMYFYQILKPYATRPQVSWLLLVEADTNTILAPVRQLRNSIWWLLSTLLLISLVCAVWVAWRLTQPIHALANVMKRYADGETTSHYHETRGDEIGVAGRAFNYLTERLKGTEQERDKAVRLACQAGRLASVGQLAAGIGHEINNPLMNMMSLAALVEQEVKDKVPQASDDLKLLQQEGERCARIVQGVLSFAREKPPEYREFDMSKLITETLQLLQHRISVANLAVITDCDSHLQMVGDPSQLQQVLVNILLNAIQVSTKNGELHVVAKKDADFVAVQIIDGGSGIAHVNIDKVFDPFFTTKPEGKGTGLGLSVSYGIVKRHGGEIYLENQLRGGLRVIILLPRRVAVATPAAVSTEELVDVA